MRADATRVGSEDLVGTKMRVTDGSKHEDGDEGSDQDRILELEVERQDGTHIVGTVVGTDDDSERRRPQVGQVFAFDLTPTHEAEVMGPSPARTTALVCLAVVAVVVGLVSIDLVIGGMG